jgi:hypothetical protein
MTMMVYETQRPVTVCTQYPCGINHGPLLIQESPFPVGRGKADSQAQAAGRVGTAMLTTTGNSIPQILPTAAADAQIMNGTSPLSNNRKPGRYPLSESTEHVLIAASAIGMWIHASIQVFIY